MSVKDLPDYTYPVSIIAYEISSLPIDIVAQTVGNIAIDVAAQSIGNINVNLAASAITLNVNIAAQDVDINIKTSTGVNLVIDKLTQTAFVEDRRTLSNNGATATMAINNYTYRRGKFFPRGCRGFIKTVEIYCDNTDSADHNLTIKLSPMPGMGATITKTLSVPAGSSADWRSIDVKAFWNYDSMFIYVRSDSDSYGRLGNDSGTPYDYYYSTDEITWTVGSARYWFSVSMAGETVGDLPVTGTINTIGIPAVSTERLYASNTNLPTTETTLKEISGAGTVEYVFARVTANTNSHLTLIRIYCDDNVVFNWQFEGFYTNGYTASTPGISLLQYAADGLCIVHLTLKFSFRRSFRIAMQAVITAGQNVTVDGLANLVR